MTVVCGDSECQSVRCRDYSTTDLAVNVIMHAVEKGFDTRSNYAYEFLASEGMSGDPDDLGHYQWMHVRSDVLNLASEALDYLKERAARENMAKQPETPYLGD